MIVDEEIMLKNKKFEVFGGLRLLLKWTNLYNKNDVYMKYNKMGGSIKIPDLIVFCLISFPTFYYASLMIWAAADKKFDLNVISTSLAAAIGIYQTSINYILFAIKTDALITVVDYLQEIVEKSK